MLYKPKFCCNCGEKIERADWNLLTSRRFCEACAVENKRHDRLPQAAIAGGVLAMMFGLGTLFGGGRDQPPPTQTLNASPVQLRSEPAAARPVEQPRANSQTTSAALVPAPPADSDQPVTAGAETASKAYYCGALTKKGTPCSRKVRSAGVRCFQHGGKPVAAPGA